jgi:iron complex outermembrane receptor protein
MALAGSVFGQEQQQPQQLRPLEEVVVTGSRIRMTDGMFTPNPVTSVSAAELDNLAPGNLIEAFDQLPQFFDNETRNTVGSKAGAVGAGNLNLRGLGTSRQLVLLNGRRMVPTNRLSTVDIGVFPQGLIRNIEVVTGGASATYGSDAVAGVVNFILDTDFEGFRGELQSGVTDRGDDDNWEVSLAGGFSVGENGHLVVGADWYDSDGLCNYTFWGGSCDALAERDWFNFEGRVTNTSGSGPAQLTHDNVTSTESSYGGIIYAPGTPLHRLIYQPDGSAVPFETTDISVVGRGTRTQVVDCIDPYTGIACNPAQGDNTRADRPSMVSPQERGSFYLNYDWDIAPETTLSVSALYGHQQTSAPFTLAVGWGGRGLPIFSDNAFLSDDIRAIMQDPSYSRLCDTMLTPGDPSDDVACFRLDRTHGSADIARDYMINRNHTLSTTVAIAHTMQGDGFFEDWNLNAWIQSGENDNLLRFRQGFRRDHVAYASDAVIDPATGNIVCHAALFDPAYSDCVPLNLLGMGQATEAALEYARGDMYVLATTEQDSAEIALDGRLGSNWAGDIFLAFGASYRDESLHQTLGPTDMINGYELNNGAGIRSLPPSWDTAAHQVVLRGTDIYPIDGGYDVKEVFGELIVPVVSDAPLMQDMTLSLASRWADYEGSGSVNAWKLGADMRFTNTFRFRSTFSHDVRAGNLAERFDSQRQTASIDDPFYGDNNFAIRQIYGGNPNVSPEEADTWTMGFVLTPQRMQGFSLSLDWSDIQIDGRIGQLGVQRIIDECFAGAQELCAQVVRDPVTDYVLEIYNTYLNIDESRITAADLEARYNRPIGSGSFGMRFLLTHLIEASITNLGAAQNELLGENDYIENRGLMALTYNTGGFNVYLALRYLGDVLRNADWVEGVDIDYNRLPSKTYADLRFGYTLDGGNSGWSVFANIQNLLDEDPHGRDYSFSRFGGSSVGSTEILGRRFTVGMRLDFE